MGTLNVSFRCVENVQRKLEDGIVCYANNLYENTFEIPKAFDKKSESVDSVITRAALNMKPPRTTREYLIKQIRKQLKNNGLPKRVLKSTIVITYMWDEYALSENGSLA